ncbi:hypothetical protein DFH11DRAFT_1512715 [Phellopilus nigrolimitatus]|nr:hypothetical protein DFH11DRAFT_1512715 [Phellopilus nigrolimitatus]
MPASVHSVLLGLNAYAYRFGALPTHLNHLLCVRLASTSTTGESSNSSTTYPYPKHAHPSPYEIFHLKPGASQSAIKSRYYELVRIHHPDSSLARDLPASVSHGRFQSIKAAHDVLTGKMRRRDFPSPSYPPSPSTSSSGWAKDDPYRAEYARRNRSRSHNVHAEWAQAAGEAEETADDRRKDRTLVSVGLGVIVLAIFPFLSASAFSDKRHRSAAQNLAQARREGREFGPVRRAQIRKQVRGKDLEQEYDERVATAERGKREGR